MLCTRRLSRSWGNCCHSCKIAVLNSSIFWHFGLRWLILRPIKSHTCTKGFMSGDIAGHGIVWTASCCKKCCTIRALCGLALSSMSIGLSANAWLSKRGTTRGASTLSRYFWPVRLPSRTHKSNLQSKEKQPQTVTPPPPKAVVPKMWLSWNEVFLWRQTLARPSVGRNKTTFIRPVDPCQCANSPHQMIMWPVKSSMAMTQCQMWTFNGSSPSHSLTVEASDYSACANVASKR